MNEQARAAALAEITDALRHGGRQEAGPWIKAEAAVAVRLHESANAGEPDPAFLAELRAALLARARGTAADALAYAPLETPFGPIYVAYRGGVVVSAGAARDSESFARAVARDTGVIPCAEDAVPEPLRGRLLAHLAGKRRFLDVDLTRLRPFQRQVLEKTAEIPRGEVRPYSWIAREIGAPGAVRAVGTALGHNPIPFIVPCHRVVRADGSLGEYSGGGPAVKTRVLAYEGAPVELFTDERRPALYRGSRTTGIFCYATCHAARRIAPENVLPFGSPARAVAAGLRACKLCRPA